MVMVFLRGTKEKTKMMLKYIPTIQISNYQFETNKKCQPVEQQ